jgi:ArsR family transcriptional regulator, lead/cadmium/zinc/bismuth-responsive transcriptional repressor
MRKSSAVAAIDPETVAEIQSSAPSQEILAVAVEMFQALADPTRLKILYALMTHEVCVRDLALIVGVSESAISHQLRLLRDRHIVQQRRAGNVIYYALSDHHLPVLMREVEYHADHVQQALPVHHSNRLESV